MTDQGAGHTILKEEIKENDQDQGLDLGVTDGENILIPGQEVAVTTDIQGQGRGHHIKEGHPDTQEAEVVPHITKTEITLKGLVTEGVTADLLLDTEEAGIPLQCQTEEGM